MSTSKSATQGQDKPTSIPTNSSHNEVTNIDAESGDIEIDSSVNEDGKRKLTSLVWDSFNRVKINGDWAAVCKACNKKLSGKGSAGTSHLKKHRDNCPRRKFRDVGQMLKATKTKEGEVEIRTFKFDQDTTRRELANMVILHEYPLSMVEHLGFHRFIGTAQPLFKIPSRNTLKNDILQIHDYERAKLKGLLEKNKGRIALTTDMWTSHNQRKGFMAITAHFVDNSWTLQSRIIRFIYVPCPHTAEMLADVMMSCLHDWNIEHKLSTLTVDNCSTNNAMIRILLDMLSDVSLLLNGDMFHMRCSAHILNLIVRDGLDVISASVERIRSSVSYWTSSPKREEKIFETVNQLGIESTKKLVLDCKTRWNSTYLMICSALIYKTVFPRLKHKDSNYKNVPTEDDWVLAKEISDKLDVFYQATEEFSGTKYPTANNYLPTVCDIRDAINEWSTSTFEQIKLMTSSMAHKFDSYWSEFHGIMVVATILDPRYKMKVIECYFPSLYGDGSSYEIIKIQEVLLRIVGEYEQKSKDSQASSSNSTHVSPSQSTMGPPKKKMSRFDQYITNVPCTTFHVKTELDYYLEEPVIPRVENFDILTWWKVNASKYPTLHCIARDILAIPVSTVASESAFSTGGRCVSPHRSRLHPKTVEALMCAQSWLWSEFNDSTLERKFEASDFGEDDEE